MLYQEAVRGVTRTEAAEPALPWRRLSSHLGADGVGASYANCIHPLAQQVQRPAAALALLPPRCKVVQAEVRACGLRRAVKKQGGVLDALAHCNRCSRLRWGTNLPPARSGGGAEARLMPPSPSPLFAAGAGTWRPPRSTS